MLNPDIIKIAKQLRFNMRGKVSEIFTGQYKSSFRGKGIEPSEIREYVSGDSLNNVDWKSTAREGKPYLKIFEESRELQTYLIVDLSKSMDYGTKIQTKKDLIIQFCLTIALSTLQTNDNLGVILYTNRVEKIIKASKGRKHILKIITEIQNFETKNTSSGINEALNVMNKIVNRRAICFVVSDNLELNMSKELKIAGKKNDLTYVHIKDPSEEVIFDIGYVYLQDIENKKNVLIDTSSVEIQKAYSQLIKTKTDVLIKNLKKNNIDYLALFTNSDIFRLLNIFFKKRIKRFH